MGDYWAAGHETKARTRPARDVGLAIGRECHLVRAAYRLPVGVSTTRIPEFQQRLLSFSQVELGWHVGADQHSVAERAQ